MASVLVHEDFAVPAADVWRHLRDFDDMTAWARGVTLRRVDGRGIGAVRFVESATGLFVERLEAHDDDGHSLAYSIVESPWPLEHYLARVRVIDAGPQACAVEWSCEFGVTTGTDAEVFGARLERMYQKFISTLREVC